MLELRPRSADSFLPPTSAVNSRCAHVRLQVCAVAVGHDKQIHIQQSALPIIERTIELKSGDELRGRPSLLSLLWLPSDAAEVDR